jgi:O-antigen biosynthesis protein
MDYSEWIDEAMIRRLRQYPAQREPELISLVTSAYNTPVEFLRLLADSVLGQDFGAGTVFDWVLVDNGSTDPATIAELQALSQHQAVRFYRVEQNLGIMGGMRFGAQKATGRYIVPVDSDDYVRPDAVRILAWFIQTHHYPALLYSDEDKVEDGKFFEAYFKPAWDPVLFFHSCYIAHLCAIDRGLAAMLGAYSDDRSRGCHDWDTFMRFFLAGYEPVHVPEVLYSWRRHSGSCAGDITSKDYIHSSHRNTLQRFLNAAPSPDYYQLNYSPLFQQTPDWRIERHAAPLPRLLVLVLVQPGDDVNLDAYRSTPDCEVLSLPVDSSLESAAALLRSHQPEKGLVRIVSSAASPLFDDWLSEAVTFFELFPDTVAAGGPVYDEADRLLTGGLYFGINGACGCPDHMRVRQDPGYFAQLWKPHSVDAVSAQHLVADGVFLMDALASGRIPAEITLPCLGEWLGTLAARWQKRVVYSPFLGVRSRADWQGRWSPTAIAEFSEANSDLIQNTRLYSRHLGLSLEDAYLPVSRESRSTPVPPLSLAVAGKGAFA